MNIQTKQNEIGQTVIEGRYLHKLLQIKTKYSDWFNRKIKPYYSENTHYTTFWVNKKNDLVLNAELSIQSMSANGYRRNHYINITVATAIVLAENTEVAKILKPYFMELEMQYQEEVKSKYNMCISYGKNENAYCQYKMAEIEHKTVQIQVDYLMQQFQSQRDMLLEQTKMIQEIWEFLG